MKKIICFLFLGVFLISLISAENIGVFKINEEMQITNYCNSGECSYMNLTSIELPNGTKINMNEGMTKNFQDFNYTYTPTINGYIYFVSCGDPNGKVVCDRDSFLVTSNGREATYNYLIASLFLILTFLGFGFLIYKDKEKMDDEKYWGSMFKKYMNKNYLRLSATIIWYNLKKNSFVLYYLIGLVDMIIIYDIAKVYNLTAVEPVFQIILYIYTWSSLVVTIIFFGQVQEWINEWLESIQKINWGELTSIK